MSMQDTPRPDVLDEMRAYEQSHRMQSRDGFRPDHAETADRYQRYADALESARADTRTAFADRDAAITRMAEYAAVIEAAKVAIGTENAWDGHARADQLDTTRNILASDAAAVLRSRDAEKWDEGFTTCDEWNGAPLDEGGSPVPPNPYAETEEGGLGQNPTAMAQVLEGLRQSAAGETRDLGSFAEYADIEIDEEGGR